MLLAGCVGVALWASGGTVPAGDRIEFEAIFRANGDGSAVEQVLPSNVAEGQGNLAVGGQYLFWNADFFCCNPAYFLRRATLNGQNVQNILGPTSISGIAVDAANGKVYFSPASDCCCDSIARTDLDGRNYEPLFPACFPSTIAVHPPTALVCWSDFDLVFGVFCGTVGANTTELVVEEAGSVKVAADALNDKLYWARSDAILRANLDGSNVEEVVPGLDAVAGIALDPAGGHIWWTEHASGKIYRADLDGSNVQDIVQGLDAPTGIGFAEANGKIYWLSVAPPEVPATSPPGLALLVLLLLGGSSALVFRP